MNTEIIYLEVSEEEANLIKQLVENATLDESTMPYETEYSKQLKSLLSRLEWQGV